MCSVLGLFDQVLLLSSIYIYIFIIYYIYTLRGDGTTEPGGAPEGLPPFHGLGTFSGSVPVSSFSCPSLRVFDFGRVITPPCTPCLTPSREATQGSSRSVVVWGFSTHHIASRRPSERAQKVLVTGLCKPCDLFASLVPFQLKHRDTYCTTHRI